jgi:hypothetical protein
MVKAALLALALPALLAGCLAGAPSHGPTGQIDGAVVDHLLRPYSNQTVYLSPLGWTDATSPLGGFTFRAVPVGTYLLMAAHDGTQGAAASVTVEEGRVSKVILQLLPIPSRDPRIVLVPPHVGFEDTASAGGACGSCTWVVPLDAGERPAQVVLKAQWDADLLGRDGLRFQVTDDAGDRLLSTTPEHPMYTGTIDGADIPAEARELRVHVQYGPDFTPRANFRLQTFMTLYYGATHDQIFGAPA